MKKLLGLTACLAFSAAPALAQTLDGGQGMQCTNDIDCGACGWVCSWVISTAGGHTCVPWSTKDGASNTQDPGWCTGDATCACTGQTCQGTSCAPLTSAGNCATDTDCTGGQICDQATLLCRAMPTSCNYDGECGSSCRCVSGACGECLGTTTGTSSGGSTGATTGAGSTGGSSTGASSSSSSTGGAGSSSGGSSTGAASSTGGAGSSTGSASGGSSTGGSACGQVGGACAQNTDCCNQYCKSSFCHCNSGAGTSFDKYPCKIDSDCCSPATCAADGKCQGQSATSGGSSSGGGSSTGSATAGTTNGAPDGGAPAAKSGCGTTTGGLGGEGFALLALGLGALVIRRRKA